MGQIEDEANEWAANVLVSSDKLKSFVASGRATSPRVRAFANDQEIAPGIVVGMLQHQRVIPWNQLNALKVRYAWKNE